MRRPRLYETTLGVDETVEIAFHKLVEAAVDQRAPSPQLKRRLNHILTLIGHPLRDRSLEEAA